jgi:hypothetical protein
MHRGDSGMIQRRGHPRLGLETVPELGVAGQLRLEHLDSDRAVQPGVVSLPHLAHPADGDSPAQPVPPRQYLPAGQLHISTAWGIVRRVPPVAEFDTRVVLRDSNSTVVELGGARAARILAISGLLAGRHR